MRLAPIALAFAVCALCCGGAFVAPSPIPQLPASDFSRYSPVAAQILSAARTDTGAWSKLSELCDDIGHRLSGSPALDKAIAWAIAQLRTDGHENVRAEPVDVPKWVRGGESLELLEPYRLPLAMLGLGLSVGGDVTAEVLVVHDEGGLHALGEKVRGKIVLFDNPMPPWTPAKGSQYGTAVRFRNKGPAMAARLGAAAVLVRSVTARSLCSPHTGGTWYDDDAPAIPGAAVATEHAALLARLADRGKKLVVRLQMAAAFHSSVKSANVIAELRGRERPDEVVVIGGHIDSWDVGQGAHDDGAGVVAAMQALTLLRKQGLVPRRTVRVVLWTNEENGLGGAEAYAKAHESELPNHVAAIEADSGGFTPTGLGIGVHLQPAEDTAVVHLRGLVKLLEPVGPQHVRQGSYGADVGPLRKRGVPAMDLDVAGATYFDYHHSHGDTLDKVDPRQLQDMTAALATYAWTLAEWEGRLDRP
jgi:carboxypeptidase Q